MNLMAAAGNFVKEMREKHTSEKVVYRRHGASEGILIDATVGRSYFSNGNRYFAVSDVEALVNRIRPIDFIISKEELGFEPEQGDTITRQSGNVYEVFPPMNESCWKWSGSNNDTYRIHAYDLKEMEASGNL